MKTSTDTAANTTPGDTPTHVPAQVARDLAEALRALLDLPEVHTANRQYSPMGNAASLGIAALSRANPYLQPQPARFYVSGGGFYCCHCCADGGDWEMAIENGYTPLPNNDLAGVYCCNCGRDDFDNADAHRPGKAVWGDFEYTDGCGDPACSGCQACNRDMAARAARIANAEKERA